MTSITSRSIRKIRHRAAVAEWSKKVRKGQITQDNDGKWSVPQPVRAAGSPPPRRKSRDHVPQGAKRRARRAALARVAVQLSRAA